MLPYHVVSRIQVVNLFYLKERGKFQLIRDGKIGPLMTGHDYVIFGNELVDKLQLLDLEGLRFEPVILWNRKADIEYTEYHRAFISDHFSTDQINDLELDGLKFFVMNNNDLFASPDLKEILESQFSHYLDTHIGLSMF